MSPERENSRPSLEPFQGSATSMEKVLPPGEVELVVFCFMAITGKGLAPS